MILPEKLQVLIADDDFMVRQMIRGRLEDLGHTVVGEATGGQQSVDMVTSLQPDIILMDIDMPDMDGIEATRSIYKLSPTPVVILTAYDTPELVEQAGEVGAGAYLVKLPTAREIERAIIIAMARFAPSTCRFVQSDGFSRLNSFQSFSSLWTSAHLPHIWVAISKVCIMPVAPTACIHPMRPPEIFEGSFPGFPVFGLV